MAETGTLKLVTWLGPTRKVLRDFPKRVRDTVGFALYHAQKGAKHESAKSLRGFGGAGVLEVVENHEGNTYRAVYTVPPFHPPYALALGRADTVSCQRERCS